MHNSIGPALIVGASGQIGTALLLELGARHCLRTARKPANASELELDLAQLTRPEQLDTLLHRREFSSIYCVGGMTHVDGCESQPQLAFATNATGPALLAGFAQRRGSPFVYFSTEYVFDGHDGPYREGDSVHPLSVYGRSKLEGERAILAVCPPALIIRTTVVYGEDPGAKNFVYTLLRTLAAGKPMTVAQDQVSTPTYNRDLALAVTSLVAQNASGIFHVCGPERMDRLDFALKVASTFNLDCALLSGLPTRDLAQTAPRPLSAGLLTERLDQTLAPFRMRTLAEGLADCRDPLQAYLALHRPTS